MNIIKATHQLAMDTNALAELSKAKGLQEDANIFYKQAYELEKKAALMTSAADKDPVPHFILLRSAVALAYKSKLYKDSQRLIEICLSENPPAFIRHDLAEINELLKHDHVDAPSNEELELEGLLTKVNAEESEITIKDQVESQKYSIIVPQHQLVDIIKQYWFQKVLVKVRQTTYGIMILEKIQAAT
ncbi:MAG: hypothetical protein AAGG68_15900 [Bacteroidota bacterium]